MLYKGCAQIEKTISWATCLNHYLKLPILKRSKKRSKVSLIRVVFRLHMRISIASYYVTLIMLGRVFCYLHNTKQRFYTIETSINPWIPEYQPEQTTLLILQLQPEQSFKGRITQRERRYNGTRSGNRGPPGNSGPRLLTCFKTLTQRPNSSCASNFLRNPRIWWRCWRPSPGETYKY